jgi:hypothetical protein
MANVAALSEAVDLATTDRMLADIIEANRKKIENEIREKGYSDIELDGRVFRITTSVASAA